MPNDDNVVFGCLNLHIYFIYILLNVIIKTYPCRYLLYYTTYVYKSKLDSEVHIFGTWYYTVWPYRLTGIQLNNEQKLKPHAI